jgi:hypothetical protein
MKRRMPTSRLSAPRSRPGHLRWPRISERTRFQGRNKSIKVPQSTGKWKSRREFKDGLTQAVSVE